MKRVIIASTNKVNASSESASITLSASHDREAVVTQVSPSNCHIYFYYNGSPSKASSQSFYEALYPEGVIDDVDTRSGFIDTTLSADEVIDILQEKGYYL